MKPLRIVFVAALAAALAFGTVGCSNKDIAAKVNGKPIKIDELNKQVEQLKKQYPQMFEGADGEGRLLDFKQRLLDNLINQELIRQAAGGQGVEVTDEELNKQIEQLRSGFKDEAQFEAALKSAGMTKDQLTQQIREQLLTQKLIEKLAANEKVTQADIKAYYDKNKAQFALKAAKRASHILFKPEDKSDAEAVLKQIKAGGDFAALAKRYSIDTATKQKGGDLGWPTTPFVPEFESALAKLQVGQLSGLVQTPYGWHIIKVTDERAASQQKLADVSKQIEQIIIQQRRADAYQKFLEKLRKDAKIEILIPELKQASAQDTKKSK